MAMMYTLVSTAKEWLFERFAQDTDTDAKPEEATKDDVCSSFSILISFTLESTSFQFIIVYCEN